MKFLCPGVTVSTGQRMMDGLGLIGTATIDRARTCTHLCGPRGLGPEADAPSWVCHAVYHSSKPQVNAHTNMYGTSAAHTLTCM